MSWAHMRKLGVAVIALWTAGLIACGSFLYSRFMESIDFGMFTQAWTRIGSGDLYPVTSLRGDFLHVHFELLLWPLSLLAAIYPNPLVLVWVQALALGACGLVVMLWAFAVIEQRLPLGRSRLVAAVALLVAIVINPISYEVMAQDFHFGPVGATFILLAAYALWRDRTSWAWIFVALCLITSDVSASFVIGLGLSALLVRRTRRSGVLMVAAGIGWLVLVTLLHADTGSHLRTGYAYLAGHPIGSGLGGVAAVSVGILGHPGRAGGMLWRRIPAMLYFLRPGGVIGLLSPWGLGIPLVVLVESALQHNPVFIDASFQNVMATSFVMIGTVLVLSALASKPLRGVPRPRAAGVLTGLVLISCLSFAAAELPGAFVHETAGGAVVSPATAAALGRALGKTPPDAEVIVALEVMGRFSARESVYPYFVIARRYPIDRRRIVVVLVRSLSTSGAAARGELPAIRWLRAHGAKVLVNSAGVQAVLWMPDTGRRSVKLPGL